MRDSVERIKEESSQRPRSVEETPCTVHNVPQEAAGTKPK